KFCAIFATAMCVVCLLIALPFLIKNDSPTPVNNNRYCKEEDCVFIWSEHNIKEYGQANKKNLLYIDYNKVAESETQIYVSKDDENDIIYLYEKLFLQDTYDEIHIYITDNRTTVDILEGIENSCVKSVSISNVIVRCVCEQNLGKAVFEYKGYRYFIVLQYPTEENDLTQLVSDMLPQ
ncbi:MAG: hypothetical protein K2M17_00775, partial [Bacilli bacterium]|nr:hypothetical protein [Bacilli bacterium]